MALKGLSPNLIWSQVDLQIDVKLEVSLSPSALHVIEPHPHGVILVGNLKLLTKHLEANGIILDEVDDHLVQLIGAHYRHCQLPISHLVNAEKLILTQYISEISYLINKENPLEGRLVDEVFLDKL